MEKDTITFDLSDNEALANYFASKEIGDICTMKEVRAQVISTANNMVQLSIEEVKLTKGQGYEKPDKKEEEDDMPPEETSPVMIVIGGQ